jgi:hypothetical protein
MTRPPLHLALAALIIAMPPSARAQDTARAHAPRPTGEEYIAREAKRLGLEPAGENGTYFQAIPLVARQPDSTSRLRTDVGELVPGRDFLPVPRLGAQLFLGGQPYGGPLPRCRRRA